MGSQASFSASGVVIVRGWRLAVPGQDVQHDASGMNVVRQRFGTCGLYRLDPIGHHGAQGVEWG